MTSSRATAALAVAALLIAALDLVVVARRGGDAGTSAGAPTAGATETLDEQLERTAAIIADVRELSFDEVPEPIYLSASELAQRAGAFIEEYAPEDAEVDARLLAALGAIPPGTDLRGLLRTALSEQVAGFYDPETEELVVGADQRDGRLGPLDEITLAHELEHALADQALGLPVEEEVEPGEEDAVLAQQSLVEGDATLSMILYAEEAMSVVDQAQLLAEQSALAAELERLTELPHYLQRTLTFPYEEGTTFVTALRDAGGWERVDAAYRDLPTTTLQILEPQRYLAGEGQASDPRDVEAPPGDWEPLAELAVGAADLLFLFEAPGGDPEQAIDDPRAAATAWRGGEVAVFGSGEATAVGLALEGEPALCAAVAAWYAAAFGPGQGDERLREFEGETQDAVLRCGGDDVRLGIAPDLETARALSA